MRTPRFGRRPNGKDLKKSSANCRAAATEPKTFIPRRAPGTERCDVAVARHKIVPPGGPCLEPDEAFNHAIVLFPDAV
jgi:hypothetical protein